MAGNEIQDLYLNGEFLPLAEGRISIEDRGFLFADGVYEVIRCKNGRLLWLDEHLGRLSRSLAAIEMAPAVIVEELRAALPELARRSGRREASVYVQVTRGPAARDFLIPASPRPTVAAWMFPFQSRSWDEVRAGIQAAGVTEIRWSRCDIKSIMLLAAVLAKTRAVAGAAAEIIWIGPEGDVREGGSSNVFALLEGRLVTHPADERILNGITRIKIMDIAGGLGIPVVERAFTRDEMMRAQELFLTSTLLDILPILSVDGQPIAAGAAGPVTLELAGALRALIERECSAAGALSDGRGAS